MSDDVRFKHPFTCILSGPSGSGKSSFCIKFLRNLRSLCTERKFEGGIIWCYSEKSAVPKRQLSALRKKIRYREGVPNNFTNARGRPCLIILDDLLNDVYSKDVCNLFTRGSHHRNISVFLITQNLFHQGRYCRDISLNAKYVVLLKNLRDKKQFRYLAHQVFPEDSEGLYRAYIYATRKPHGYLVLDLSQDTDDRLRFRTHIFPGEGPPIIYAAINNETNKVALSHPPSTQNSLS